MCGVVIFRLCFCPGEIIFPYLVLQYARAYLWILLLFLCIEGFTAARPGHKGDTWSASQWHLIDNKQYARIPITLGATLAIAIRGWSLQYILWQDPATLPWFFMRGPLAFFFVGGMLTLIGHIAWKMKYG